MRALTIVHYCEKSVGIGTLQILNCAQLGVLMQKPKGSKHVAVIGR
jgi:hypothetical protein